MSSGKKTEQGAFEVQYGRLNKAQKEAVDALEGPVLVVAGPGSGKTQILSLRVANILQATDMRPANILCLTFTDSAATNMRQRLESIIGSAAYRVGIYTFHSFTTDVISRYPEYFFDGASFLPADELMQIEVLEDIFLAMPHDNPLRKEHPEEGFIYLSHTRKAIQDLKRAGVTPHEAQQIIDANEAELDAIHTILRPVFKERMSLKLIPNVADCVQALRSLPREPLPVPHLESLTFSVAASLERAVVAAVHSHSTEPLSAWKQRWIKKNDDGEQVLKDSMYISKMRALAEVYADYTHQMHTRGYFDFDDMLLRVIAALQKYPTLKYELQEQYQYLLVDEFQDTNDAQMRLLFLLTDASANEGRPNIMAVGDDDQAIYKFQGAEISNILNFKRVFRDPRIIVLTDNYRSTQHILDVARHIIKQGEERLERLIPNLSKELKAANTEIKNSAIESRSFPSAIHQYAWIARDIKKRISAGEKPQEFALIARNHWTLEEVVPFLHEAGIPVEYEREQSVFEEPHIRQLILLAKFVHSLMSKTKAEADELLPEIMSFPFWQIERLQLWNISQEAYRQHTPWIDVMLASTDPRIRSIAEFLLEAALISKHEPLEKVIDILIGSHVSYAAPSEESDDEHQPLQDHRKAAYVSPFKAYYFSKEKFANSKAEYLAFLSSLRAFVEALREYKRGEMLSVADLVAFVDLHEKHGVLVTDRSPFSGATHSIRLLSAHKAKGLEFETVYVLSCQDDIWVGRNRASLLPFPINMPIAPAGDTDDDKLRLLYVALTRAKRRLVLLSYELNDNGASAARLRFLNGEGSALHVASALLPTDPEEVWTPEAHGVLLSAWEAHNRPPFIYEEKALLLHLVENYQLSATHLNNFLDITKGGPQLFLEQNLLRFPQAKTVSGSFGTAVHKTIERMYRHTIHEDGIPALEIVLAWFDEALLQERLGPQEYALFSGRGKAALSSFYAAKKEAIDPAAHIEVNFAHQGVMVGNARLTGKIDKITRAEDGAYIVADFKTGAAVEDWQGHTPFEKIKLHRYRQQLLFYKLLVERSKDFEGAIVPRGILEFVEPKNGKIIDLPLALTVEESKRLELLVEAVYTCITTLSFPDTSRYTQDISGVEAFEEDLLRGVYTQEKSVITDHAIQQ